MTDIQLQPRVGPDVSRPTGLGSGRVFYVNQQTGDNANNGLSPNTPFLTITYALTACSANFGDYIFVLQAQDASEPAYPVNINVHAVHVIGLGRHSPDPLQRINGGGNACFQITGMETEIAGFGFHTTGAADVGITTPASAYVCWVHHCLFAGSSCAQGLTAGIGVAGQQFPWWLIEDCKFSSPNGVGCTEHGIRGGPVCATIRRNYFTAPAASGGECIHSPNVEIGAIVDNYFYSPISDAGVVGWAIFLEAAGMEGGPITNNHAMQTGDGTGLNPYRDTSSPGDITAVSHGWGMNYSGQAVIAPAIA